MLGHNILMCMLQCRIQMNQQVKQTDRLFLPSAVLFGPGILAWGGPGGVMWGPLQGRYRLA